MSKWKCEICGVEFENFHAQGFDNKIYCPLCYFKRENQELKKQLEAGEEQYTDLVEEKEELKQLYDSTILENQELNEKINILIDNVAEYEDECNKYKKIIDKAINWTKEYTMQWDSEDDVISDMEILLNILKEVK